MENKFEYAKKGEPGQCQANEKQGQCRYKAVNGTEFCSRHDINKLRRESADLRNYRLNKWQARVDDFANSSGVKSLREEIGILRMILEEMFNQCKDPTDILIFSPRISDLVMKVEKVVSSCHRLENSTGMLLDKSAALVLAGRIVDIIAQEVTDPHKINRIADQIASIIIGNVQPDATT